MLNNSRMGGTDDDDSENIIPTMEYVYVVLTAVTSGLSIFGGTCICVLYFAFKDLRSPARQLLLFLAFSDAMLAFGNLLGIIWYLYSDSAIINKSEGYCDFQSAMTIYFSMTSFAWTVTMATSLFVTVVRNKQNFTITYMKLFHILAWIPAGIITIIALSMNVLGTDTTLEQASWCWIDPRVPNALLWQFVTGKFFEIVAYITTVVLYTLIKIFLIRQAKKNIGRVNARRSRRDRIAEANRKLTFVPLVFIICRIWGTLRFLIGNFGQDIVDAPFVTWINPLQGIGDSIQGFANFVLYFFSTRSIRRRMFPCTNKIQDVSGYNSDIKTDTAVRVVKKNAVVPIGLKPETVAYSTDIDNRLFSTERTLHGENTKSSVYKVSIDEKVNAAGNINLAVGTSDELSTDIAIEHKPDSVLKPTTNVTFVIPITSTPSNSQDHSVVLNPSFIEFDENSVTKESKESRKEIQVRHKTPVVQFKLEESYDRK